MKVTHLKTRSVSWTALALSLELLGAHPAVAGDGQAHSGRLFPANDLLSPGLSR
jgi:hypothetical protein